MVILEAEKKCCYFATKSRIVVVFACLAASADCSLAESAIINCGVS